MKDEDMLKLMHKHEKVLGDAYHGKKEKITVDLVLFMEMYEVVYSAILVREYEKNKEKHNKKKRANND